MSLFPAPPLSRRAFVTLGSRGVVASWFLGSRAPVLASSTDRPRGSAKNCIFVSLGGAPSHSDTFDLKEGPWTPRAFAPASYFDGAFRFPQGLMPNIAGRLGDVALVRSCLAWALVHGLAQNWNQIARNPTGALGPVAPHLGSVVALEMERYRAASDPLPAFLSLNAPGITGAGYFPSRYGPFALDPDPSGIESVLAHPDGLPRFRKRWEDLTSIDLGYRSGPSPFGKAGADFAGFYDDAKKLVESSEIGALFSFTAAEIQPYGLTSFGASCLVAKKVLAGRKGARFIHLALDGWDHHANIYKTGDGLFDMCGQLDPALGSLLRELKSTPGEQTGKTLLDETLVVVMGEFGRTPGPLTGKEGRDHFLRFTALLAGGGVRGGRALGRTDARGDALLEPGWSGNRNVRPEDLAATIYSALGIDWTTTRTDDPFGRGFEYVPDSGSGFYRPVREVFE